jgi:hypothetical protein
VLKRFKLQRFPISPRAAEGPDATGGIEGVGAGCSRPLPLRKTARPRHYSRPDGIVTCRAIRNPATPRYTASTGGSLAPSR